MVQTYQSPVRVYKYPFELVMVAYEKRFPTCPQIPIFVGSEILSEYRSLDGAEEVIERKCQLNVEAPYLVKKIAGVDYVYFNQKNALDRRKRTLTIEASNISFSSRVIVKETCNYYVHEQNEDWTCFEQSASLDVKSFFGFETTVEKLAVKQYAANLAKGKEILEFFIDDLIKSGVTYIPRFVEDSCTVANNSCDERSLVDSAIEISKSEIDDEITEIGDTSANSTRKKSIENRENNSQTPTQPIEINDDDLVERRRSSALKRGTSLVRNGASANNSSFDNSESSKLEADYIQRFLGQLTQLEESRLCELKYGLRAAHKGKMPNDAHLLRFLRARDFDVHKARDMIITSLLWRKQHNVDKLLNDFVPSPILAKYFPGGWHHADLEGRPLFILRLGQMDVKGILRAVGLEAVVKLTLSICEEGLLKAADATKRLGKPISTWTLLIDLEGLSLRHLWNPGVQSLLRIIETVEAHYPETMGLVFIARAPRVFPVLWTLVSPFINENTRKKFLINSNENIVSELSKYIDKQFLPDFLGGPCASELNSTDNWHVPKSEYQPVNVDKILRENEDDILTSTYTSATIHRSSPHEVCVQVLTVGCVLTWDFDIIKSECEFLIYHTNKTIKPTVAVHNVSPTMNPVEFVTSALNATSLLGGSSSNSSPNFVVAADPELRLGHELRIVERPVFFADGDSMQGSHYCSMKGTYIMQWRIPELPLHHYNMMNGSETIGLQSSALSGCGPTGTSSSLGIGHHETTLTPTIGLIGSHKCKLMYYYELLDSMEFKGSVASLESCHSSFGSLAAIAATAAGPISGQSTKEAKSS